MVRELAWRTDEPCPVCGTGLTVVANGRPVLRAEAYTAPDGKVFWPSLFVTLTCPSYGRVTSDGTRADPGAYDWLRYGIQPKNARPGLRPGCCKGKSPSPRASRLGGRRILVSRKWSGKTLADHRGDRKARLTAMLGISATDPSRYSWELVSPGDPDHMPNGQRLLHIVADRIQWQTALEQARRRAAAPVAPDSEATGRAA